MAESVRKQQALDLSSLASTETCSVEDTFEELEQAFKRLRPGSTPGLESIAAMKAFWKAVRIQSGVINLTEGGVGSGKFISDKADQLLERIYLFSIQKQLGKNKKISSLKGVCILALGSFGRQEMAPFSDWDLLVLYDGDLVEKVGIDFEAVVGNILRPLWDAGLNLGHAVRTTGECIGVMEEGVHVPHAMETATALLEARFVTGDRSFGESFLTKNIRKFFRRHGKPFVDAKMQEALLRHSRQEASIYHTQPNIKEHPGGLRDFQLATWIDLASRLSGHLPRLSDHPLVSKERIQEAKAGYSKLLTTRNSLHLICGRKQEVLDHMTQEAVAENLGFLRSDDSRPSEQLLKDYFTSAAAIHLLADTVIRRYREEQALLTGDLDQLRRRPVDANFTRIGDYLYTANEHLFKGENWLRLALKAIFYSARFGISISQEIREGIRARLESMNEELRCDPGASKLFLEIMTLRSNVGKALRSMRETGLLGEYMPEFAEIQRLVVQDIFHDFAVDEHTIFVVEQVDHLYASGEASERLRREVLEKLPRPKILRLAALFHDLGKSRGGPGHSKRGALMVPRIAERLGLDQKDTRTLIFLVKYHLLLSRSSLRRDSGDEQLLADLRQTIRTQERLDLLYILTCADIAAVGRASFPRWKEEQLADLYLRLSSLLNPDSEGTSGSGLECGILNSDVMLEEASDDYTRQLVQEHFERVPKRYLVEISEEEVRLHLKLIRMLEEDGRTAAASVRGDGGLVDLWLASTNRDRRFHLICGSFLGHSVNVVSAMAYTRSDGVILDHFRVSLSPDGGVPSKAANVDFWLGVAEGVEKALSGEQDITSSMDAARRRIPRTTGISRNLEPEVRLDNKLSENFTVVDVRCGDRIGLLYGLSRALDEMRCVIHFAKVDTIQGMATDVFYVTDRGGGKVEDKERLHLIKILLKGVAEDLQSSTR